MSNDTCRMIRLIADLRLLILAVSATLFSLFGSALAQEAKKGPRVGFLGSGSASSMTSRTQSFQQGLRDLGYVEGRNIIIDYRFAEGKTEQFAALANELIGLKPDVLVTSGSPGIRALMNATSTVPIVMAAIGDAIGSGFVKSLSQPGSNITGLSFLDQDISTKRLELLKESLPSLTRVGILRHRTSGRSSLEATAATSRALKVQMIVYEVQADNELGGVFLAAKKAGVQAVNVMASPILFAYRKELVAFSINHRLPGVYENKEFAEAGGLLSYGANLDDMFRRSASYVDKIIKGTKPADLPVEQPTKFEFVINLKTAKQIGVTIPPNVLARADRVIR